MFCSGYLVPTVIVVLGYFLITGESILYLKQKYNSQLKTQRRLRLHSQTNYWQLIKLMQNFGSLEFYYQ